MQSTNTLREVTEAVNDVLDKCSAMAPQLIDTDKSIRSIRAQTVQLEDPTSAINEKDYMENFDIVVAESKV